MGLCSLSNLRKKLTAETISAISCSVAGGEREGESEEEINRYQVVEYAKSGGDSVGLKGSESDWDSAEEEQDLTSDSESDDSDEEVSVVGIESESSLFMSRGVVIRMPHVSE